MTMLQPKFSSYELAERDPKRLETCHDLRTALHAGEAVKARLLRTPSPDDLGGEGYEKRANHGEGVLDLGVDGSALEKEQDAAHVRLRRRLKKQHIHGRSV